MKKAEEAKEGRIFGYARVSTDKQDADRQKLDIMAYCAKIGRPLSGVTVETISSRKAQREVYQVIDGLKAGDMLVVTELSRLARSAIELDEICAKVIRAGATLKSLSPEFTVDGTIQGQTMKFALGISAQIERDFISERTKSALKARKAEGVTLGRPRGQSKLDEKREEIERYLRLGINKTAIAKLVGCSRSTLLNWLASNGQRGKEGVRV
jgi:DNA invertase Pin-like site-specific DNA recombinase